MIYLGGFLIYKSVLTKKDFLATLGTKNMKNEWSI